MYTLTHPHAILYMWSGISTCRKRSLLFWNQTFIFLDSIFDKIGHSLISRCHRIELGFGHSIKTLSNASTCSGVYLTYLLESNCLEESLCIDSTIATNPL
eukprot:TRINITY_DN6084_c1_g1_i1.p1 TRINITY_DN6084_c1_g1~~TRINITY_DN6084_c1_g1_i1.p1  ORF type:complete len:100 (-),score=3.15 TRINITY_DN6084_c1_g1_i1:212-511(-)